MEGDSERFLKDFQDNFRKTFFFGIRDAYYVAALLIFFFFLVGRSEIGISINQFVLQEVYSSLGRLALPSAVTRSAQPLE